MNVRIEDVPTLFNVGESPTYDIRTYDTDTKLVLERSYPQTTTVRSVTFSSENYSIYVDANLVVTVTKYTYSDPFDINIKVPSYEPLVINPVDLSVNL